MRIKLPTSNKQAEELQPKPFYSQNCNTYKKKKKIPQHQQEAYRKFFKIYHVTSK